MRKRNLPSNITFSLDMQGQQVRYGDVLELHFRGGERNKRLAALQTEGAEADEAACMWVGTAGNLGSGQTPVQLTKRL